MSRPPWWDLRGSDESINDPPTLPTAAPCATKGTILCCSQLIHTLLLFAVAVHETRFNLKLVCLDNGSPRVLFHFCLLILASPTYSSRSYCLYNQTSALPDNIVPLIHQQGSLIYHHRRTKETKERRTSPSVWITPNFALLSCYYYHLDGIHED